MIHKSYLIENNIEVLKNNIVLFYGENQGLIQEFKLKIYNKYIDAQILKYNQEEIIDNSNNFFNEINNSSLFNDKKVFLIDKITDKFLEIIKQISILSGDDKIFLFSNILEKKSKIRSFFEKEKNKDIVPCYQDNSLTIQKIIFKKLANLNGLTEEMVNLISSSCSNDRAKLNNEIEKIKQFFYNKPIEIKYLRRLLNLKEEDDFNYIKDSAISGDKEATNNLLNSTAIENEKTNLYLSMLNQRLIMLKNLSNKNQNIEKLINNLKPPIFWKEKPAVIAQAKKWNEERLDNAIDKTYKFEIQLKTNSLLNKNILLKKLLIDICNLANAA